MKRYDASLYVEKTELMERIKAANLDRRTIANALNISPGTLGNQLKGWTPLRKEVEDGINRLIQEKTGHN